MFFEFINTITVSCAYLASDDADWYTNYIYRQTMRMVLAGM